MVSGFTKFKERFQGFENQYVIIGGTACDLIMENEELPFVLQKTDIRDSDEKVVEIEMERLRTFTNHPFKVIGDSQMIELHDSIKKYGVLNPLIDRPRKEGYYEIISGHFLWSLFAVAMNEM